MEWPARIKKTASASAVANTSDIFPTFAEIVSQPLPNRPLDGMSLVPFLKDPSKQRQNPLWFLGFKVDEVFGKMPQPYIDPKLQEGTSPPVKKLVGKHTRDFLNFKYTKVSEYDFSGERSIYKDHYKLMLEGQTPNKN